MQVKEVSPAGVHLYKLWYNKILMFSEKEYSNFKCYCCRLPSNKSTRKDCQATRHWLAREVTRILRRRQQSDFQYFNRSMCIRRFSCLCFLMCPSENTILITAYIKLSNLIFFILLSRKHHTRVVNSLKQKIIIGLKQNFFSCDVRRSHFFSHSVRN